MSCYHHFTPEERESILVGLVERKSMRDIARELNRSASSISRELKRNYRSHEKCKYSPLSAQKKYEKMKKRKPQTYKLMEPAIKAKVEELLQSYWSPEQISHRLQKEKSPIEISFNTIYRGISKGLISKPSIACLRIKANPHRSRKRKSNCGCIPVTHSIHDRPKEIDERTQAGHWESDTVQGQKNGACIATHVERKSRFCVLLKLDKSGVTDQYMRSTHNAFKLYAPELRRSFTVDHGKEFAGYQMLMDSLHCIVYFADPYSPNQRATNENTNGLLRQFVPKGCVINCLSETTIDSFAYRLNTRPRKCLDWITPLEVFSNQVLHLT